MRNIRAGISVVIGIRNVQSDGKKRILLVDAKKNFGWTMVKSLPYMDFDYNTEINLIGLLNTPNDKKVDFP